jgi:predicted nuclease of predicted toxin-antitoxin system
MKFLLDQSTDARLAHGHDATRIGEDYPGSIPDEQVLAIARAEGRMLITDDRDFGELVIRSGLPHAGVIYLRLGNDAELVTKQGRLHDVLTHHAAQLGQFLVVTPHRVRVHQPKRAP